ncbi:GNAT family N-acetyltransferase [Pseudomonas borbori]
MPSSAEFFLRDYQPNDLAAIIELFTEAVDMLAATHYDAAQRAAWAPEEVDREGWQMRLATLQVRLADDDGKLAGFIGFSLDGHIDLLFTSPAYARRGVARALYQDAEQQLATAGNATIFTEASLVARPFFAQQGFAVTEAQTVLRGAVALQRFAMSKTLQ